MLPPKRLPFVLLAWLAISRPCSASTPPPTPEELHDHEVLSIPYNTARLERAATSERENALKALADVPTDTQSLIPRILWMLETDESMAVRAQAAATLGGMSPPPLEAIPQLIKSLGGGDKQLRFSAIDALATMGPPSRDAVPRLLQIMRDDYSELRQAAALALGRIGPDARDAIPALHEALHEKDPMLRANAATALGGIGPEARSAIPDLIQMLRDSLKWAAESAAAPEPTPDPRFRGLHVTKDNENLYSGPAAEQGIAGIGPEAAPEAVPLLMEALKAQGSQNFGDDMTISRFRVCAALALGKMGAAATPAIPLLKDAQGDTRTTAYLPGPDPHPGFYPPEFGSVTSGPYSLTLGRAATNALTEIGGPNSGPDKTASEEMKASGAFPSADIKPGPKSTVPELIATLGQPDKQPPSPESNPYSHQVARATAMQSLGEIGPEAGRAIPILKAFMLAGLEPVYGDMIGLNIEGYHAGRALMKIDPANAEFYLALGAFGPASEKTISILLDVLEDPEKAEWRRMAACSLAVVALRSFYGKDPGGFSGEWGPDFRDVVVDVSPAIAPITQLLESDDKDLRLAAVGALKQIGVPAKASAPQLVKALQREDSSHQAQVLRAIWHVRPDSDDIAPALAPYLKSADPGIRLEASTAIAQMAGHAYETAPELIDALQDSNQVVRSNCAQALSSIVKEHPSDEIFATLFKVLRDESQPSNARAFAASAMQYVPSCTDEIYTELEKATKSIDPFLKNSANVAIAHFNRVRGEEKSVAALIEEYTSGDVAAKIKAATALGMRGPAAIEAAAMLEGDMKNGRDEYLKVTAAGALVAITPEAVDPVMVLNILCYSENEQIRAAAGIALKKVTRKSVPGILEATKSPGSTRWALAKLSSFTPQDWEAVPRLITALGDSNLEVQKGALVGLRQIGQSAADSLPKIRELVDSPDPMVAALTAQALMNIAPETDEGFRACVKLLKNPDAAHRVNAIRLLVRVKQVSEEAKQALEVTTNDEDPNVRNAARDALKTVTVRK